MQNFFTRNNPSLAAGTALLPMSMLQRCGLWEYFSSVRKFSNKIYFRLIQHKVDILTESKFSFLSQNTFIWSDPQTPFERKSTLLRKSTFCFQHLYYVP